jgi:hypothetical protein
MKHVLFAGLALLLCGTVSAQCLGESRPHGHVHWSEPTRIVAPNRSWQVEVRPVYDADENRTPVILVKCGESRSWPLLTLRRSADVYWSADSRHLFVVDHPLSGTNQLLLFSVPGLAAGAQEPPPDVLDKIVNDTLLDRLGKGAHVQSYLPTLVSWTNNDLLLAVGGAFYTQAVGPLTRYCYGLRIDIGTLRLEQVLSEKDLKSSTGQTCRILE